VRGRTSGLPRTTPLAVIEVDGRRWVWSPWGEVHWVRNLRAAGRDVVTFREQNLFFGGVQAVQRRGEALTGAGFRATRINTVGGFLRKGNATVLVGVEKDRLHRALLIVRDNCETRTEYFVPTAPGEVGEPYPLDPIQVQVGGATVFVLPIVRYDPAALASVLRPEFELVDSMRHDHVTLGGNTQRFQFSRFIRR